MKINKFEETHKYGKEYEDKMSKYDKIKVLIKEIWGKLLNISSVGITEYYPGNIAHYSIIIGFRDIITKKNYKECFDIFDFFNNINSIENFSFKESFNIISTNLDELIDNLETLQNSSKYNL